VRPGGTLVYSTCSLTVAQNEGVVTAFLEAEANARIVPITHFGDTGSPVVPASPAGCAAAVSAGAAAERASGAASDAAAVPAVSPPSATALDGGEDALRAHFASLHRSTAPGTAARPPPCVAGGVPGTVRFEPAVSGCGGLFIARVTKIAAA